MAASFAILKISHLSSFEAARGEKERVHTQMTSKLRLARDVMRHFDKGVKISIKILYVTDVVCESS